MSKWNKYSEQVDSMLNEGRTDWTSMARDIIPDSDDYTTNALAVYIYRRSKKTSVVDETLHRGNLKEDTWKVAWVKDAKTGVSALVRNPDFRDAPVIDYELIRQDMIDEFKALSPKVKKYKRKKIKDAHCLVLDIADLHVGKLSTMGASGKNYDVREAVDRAIIGAEKLIDKSSPYNIDKVFFIIGNDVIHTDTPTRTTTSGTPQDTDGMWYDNFKVARVIYCTIIKKLSTIAPVEVIHCPSNHDYMTGFMLADAVYCYFHNDDNVTFNSSNRHRKYTSYGLNFLGFSHGDGAKMSDIPMLAAHEAPILWAETKYRYTYLHHIHHKDVKLFQSGKDYIGMTVEHVRSPSETDRWHSDNGFTGAKVAVEAFIHHPLDGQVSRLTHNF